MPIKQFSMSLCFTVPLKSKLNLPVVSRFLCDENQSRATHSCRAINVEVAIFGITYSTTQK